jgi:hypothetical protein
MIKEGLKEVLHTVLWVVGLIVLILGFKAIHWVQNWNW